KCKVIYQSAQPVILEPTNSTDHFEVAVIGHLRTVKDPMRTACAARLLPNHSKITIRHIGQILEDQYIAQVETEMQENPRYRWLGKQTHSEALQQLAFSQLFVLTSIQEGAPGVISEAIVNDVPIVASKIEATIGLLGDDYPGFFEVGNTRQLAELLWAAETDGVWMDSLRATMAQRKPLFLPATEKNALKTLLAETF
ncbi:MAG: glycosyltransferase, partial [Planctomycetota bacterium]|nr:glycosyltransferase [Planctomycetota bacterium]